MRFYFYVLNYDFNLKKVINFNIFNNWLVQENVEKEIKKYLKSSKKYTKIKRRYGKEDITLYGFEALCEEIRHLIMWQEWSRAEYEIGVCDAFEDDINKLEKWDCYMQALPNIEIITRECIYQYKKQIKEIDK